MLDYNEFVEKLKKELLDNMSTDFKNGYKAAVKQGSLPNKPDIVQDILIIESNVEVTKNVEAPKLFILPVFEDLYKKKNKGDFNKTIAELAKTYEKRYRNMISKTVSSQKQEPESISKKVFFVVENYAEVKEQLDGIVHKKLGDYVLIAKLLKDMNDETIDCVPVGHEVMKELGMNDGEVFKVAIENTKELFPPKLEKLNYGQYYITNEKEVYGATCVFMPDGPLASLADKENKDILIIPASKNGCILEPVEEITDDVISEIQDALDEFSEYGEVLGKEPLVFSHENKKLVTHISQLTEQEEVKKSTKSSKI